MSKDTNTVPPATPKPIDHAQSAMHLLDALDLNTSNHHHFAGYMVTTVACAAMPRKFVAADKPEVVRTAEDLHKLQKPYMDDGWTDLQWQISDNHLRAHVLTGVPPARKE